jgi:phosphoacetylglucosamine mutase
MNTRTRTDTKYSSFAARAMQRMSERKEERDRFLAYGTAGFRARHDCLHSCMFRCGAIAALVALFHNNNNKNENKNKNENEKKKKKKYRTSGCCITASHNEARDNGVKIIAGSGEVLEGKYERACEELVNAQSEREILEALDAFIERLKKDDSDDCDGDDSDECDDFLNREDGEVVVYFGRDTRESGEELVTIAIEGARMIFDCLSNDRSTSVGRVCDRGVVTTPMLHYFVYEHGRIESDNSDNEDENKMERLESATQERAYFKRLAFGYLSLIERDDDDDDDDGDGSERKNVVKGLRSNKENLPSLHIDCANGVGYIAFEKLLALFDEIQEKMTTTSNSLNNNTIEKAIDVVLLNGPQDGPVNLNCGSDYVQKNQKVPNNSDNTNAFKNKRCASVDGDCDRLVYFSTTEEDEENDEEEKFKLCDGDKISILIAFFLIEQLFLAGLAHKISLGIAHTAYSNGAFTEFCEQNGVETICAKTGVKNVHKAAEENFDIGIYFESNGHGTALFSRKACEIIENELLDELTNMSSSSSNSSNKVKSAISMTKLKALLTLKATIQTINPAVGDAISSVLLIEAILRIKGNMPFSEWHEMYRDLPSVQTKVSSSKIDRLKFECFDAERKCSKPEGLQARIDEILLLYSSSSSSSSRSRAFVRPSGTEDIVRIYAEAETIERCKEIAVKVEHAVIEFCVL